MCGNCDDELNNDGVRCDGQPLTNATDPVVTLREISESCADGKHSDGRSGFPRLNCSV